MKLILFLACTCVITNLTDARRFPITDTKLYVPLETLSTQDNIKLFREGHPLELAKRTTLVFSNEDLSDIMKIVMSFKNVVFLIKDVTEILKNEIKEQKGGLLSMLAATLGASLLGNMLAGKGVTTGGERTNF